jgi:hypothetical protein
VPAAERGGGAGADELGGGQPGPGLAPNCIYLRASGDQIGDLLDANQAGNTAYQPATQAQQVATVYGPRISSRKSAEGEGSVSFGLGQQLRNRGSRRRAPAGHRVIAHPAT